MTENKRLEGNSTVSLYARLESNADGVVSGLLDAACSATGASASALVLLDETRRRFSRIVTRGPVDGTAARPLFLCALAEQGLFVIEDVRRSREAAAVPELRAAGAPRAFASVRLTDEAGEPLGALCVLGSEPSRLDTSALGALGGTAQAYLATQEDLARLRARHALHLNELHGLRGVVGATAMLPTITTDLSGVIRTINASAGRCFGFHALQVAGKVALADLAVNGDRETFAALLASSDASAEPRDQCFHRHDGSTFFAEVNASPICDDDGEETGYVFVIQDVTERRRADLAVRKHTAALAAANLELSRSARLKGDFIAGMSHELRTPLNAILGFAEALEERVYGALSDDQRRAVGEIRQSGLALQALSDDVLDLFKAEAQHLELDIRPVLVADLARRCLRAMQESPNKKHLATSLRLDGEVGSVEADEARLAQIIVNLWRAAAEAATERGAIGLTVAPHPTEDAVRFTVWDTGMGLSTATRERFFEAFGHTEVGHTGGRSGTGVGLALSRRLIELHGGTVEVESEAGSGTQLTVTLPRRYERPAVRRVSNV